MAWLFQDTRQKKRLGEKNAPWYVGYKDHEGKGKKQKIGTKTHAKAFKAKIESEASRRTYDDTIDVTWSDFSQEYQSKILASRRPNTQTVYRVAMSHLERLVKPKGVAQITTSVIDDYISKRSRERGEKPGSKVSPATINNELRVFRAMLRKAKQWKYVRELPEFSMVKELSKAKRWVTEDDFALIYQACEVARKPFGLPYPASRWWEAFITFGFLTGWRKGEILSLLWEDIDLDNGRVMTRGEDNKGGRDEWTPLHPLVIEHVSALKSFSREVFSWPHGDRLIWDQFHAIQKHAGISLPCSAKHEHSESCHFYGFHDLRRAFATVTAKKIDAKVLQSLMRHKSYSTTLRYIDMRPGLQDVTESFTVPKTQRRAT